MIWVLIMRRALLGLITMLVVSVMVFAATEILPGDTAEAVLGQGATPETVAAMRQELGLDRPAYIRYADWLISAFKGDLGKSLSSGREISEIVASRLPNTLLLAGFTAAIAVPLALIIGFIAALKAGTAYDRIVTVGTLCVISGPEFLVATLLTMLFAVQLGWLPASAYLSEHAGFTDTIRAMALPMMTLTLAALAPMIRMTRSAILSVLGTPAIEMAILKGLPRSRIVLRHALPNAIAPIANVMAMNLAYLVGGIVVVETIFSFPGMAKLLVESVSVRDFPTVQACSIIFCGAYVGLNLVADIVSIVSNPRIRYPR